MTTPAPPGATPVEIPVRRTPPTPPAAAGGTPARSGGSSLTAFLSTRNGKLTAAGGVVVLYALYRRYKTNAAAAATDSSTSTAGAGVPTADTTDSDLFSELEPLIENMSGFTDASTIEQQLATLQKGLTSGQTTGTGTTGSTGTTGGGPGPLFPTQVHQVGSVGTTVDLRSYVAQLFPKATKAQQDEIVWNTVQDPANAQYHLGTGKIPGGAKVTFLSSPVK